MFVRDGKKFDITADFIDEEAGLRHIWPFFSDPVNREQYGITEVADIERPVVDERVNTVTLAEDGTYVVTPLSAEDVEKVLVAERANACYYIDSLADQRRYNFVGDAGRAIEYQEARIQAQAYKDAGYAGDVPSYVQSGMAAGQSAQESADAILAMAASWLGALDEIRKIRLATKAEINSAPDLAAVDAARESGVAQLTAIKAE